MNVVKPVSRNAWFGLYFQSAFTAVVCFFCLGMLLIQGADWLEDALIAREKQHAQHSLPGYGVVLSNELFQYYSILQEVDSFVVSQTNTRLDMLSLDDFGKRHRQLLPGIHSFSLRDGQEIQWVYPSATLDEWAGLSAIDAVEGNHTLGPELDVWMPAAGPSSNNNLSSEPILVARHMIERPGKTPLQLGLLIDSQKLFASAGFDQNQEDLRFAVRDAEGNLLFGSGVVFSTDPVIYSFEVPGDTWEIGANPVGGWAAAGQTSLSVYWLVGAVFALLVSVIVYLILIRRVRLMNLVSRHTRELEDEIWQRQRVEQALLANEARFRLIYENLPIGYQSMNTRGDLIDVNYAWLTMLGYSRMEVIGSKFTDYLSPESVQFFPGFFQDYKQTGQVNDVELGMLRKDGTPITVILDGRIGFDEEGNFRQTHCILRDVTESKRAEQALRESEARYSSLFHDNHSVMLLVDPNSGEIVDANPAACAFYDYSVDAIKHKNINDINILPSSKIQKRMARAEMDREHHFEFRHRLRNGEIRDVEVYSGPITMQGRHLLYSIVHDISKRKKAEQALKASREELERERDLISRVMETSPVSIFMVNHQDQVTFANAHACRTFNLQKQSPADAVFQIPDFQLMDLVGQLVGRGCLPFYQIIHDTGSIYGRLYAVEWPDRERIFLSASGAPLFNEEGEVDAAIIIAEDVTEEVLSEKALRESEERFRSAFEFSTVGMALTGLDGRFMMVNQALCDMLGYNETELTGQSYLKLTHPEDMEINRKLFERTREGDRRSFTLEKRYIHKDGRVVWVALDSSLTRDPDGKPLYFITHMQDITRGKHAEEALKASEQRYRMLFERNPQAMWVHDEENFQFLAVNEAMERQYGFTRDELLHKTILDIRPEEEIPLLLESVRNISDGYSHTGIWKHRRKDQRLLDVETSSDHIDFGGKSARLVLAVDVTERLQIETASQQRARELELLSNVSSLLRQAQTQEAMVSILIDKAVEIAQASAAAVFTFGREGIVLSASLGFSQPIAPPHLSMGDRLFRLSRDERLLYIPDTCVTGPFTGSDVFEELRQDVCGCVIVPLKTADAVIGLVFLGWKAPHDFKPDEQRMLTAVAEIAGNALHRSGMMELLEQRVGDRTRELSALYALSAVASESLNFDAAVEKLLKRLLEAMPGKIGAIHLLSEGDNGLKLSSQQGIPAAVTAKLDHLDVGEGLIGSVLTNDGPVLIADISDKLDLPGWEGLSPDWTYLGIPIRSHGKDSGVLSVFSRGDSPISLEDIALLASAADQIGVTLENLRLRQQGEQVAVQRERERLARELHDSVTQSLYSLTLFSEVGHRMIHSGDTTQLDHVLSRLSETSLQALKEMRLLVYELRPSALEKDGLIGAIHKRLEAVEKRAGIQTYLNADDRLVLPFSVEEALYGISLEALNNSLKHARASSITVQIQTVGDKVRLDIADNGVGFDPNAASHQGGFGLVTLRERTERLGGQLEIETLPGKGTRVRVEINY